MAKAKQPKLTAKQAIVHVLGTSKKPMRVPEIAEAAIPLTNLGGATPKQTIYSVLYTAKDAPWIRAGRGTFKMKPARKAANA